MYSSALARYNPDHTGSYAAAGGGIIGTLVLQSLAGNAIAPLSEHRNWAVGLAGAAGGAAGAAAVAPPGQRVGAAVGTMGGLAVSYGIAAIPGLPMWLKAPLALLAIPAGTFVGSRF